MKALKRWDEHKEGEIYQDDGHSDLPMTVISTMSGVRKRMSGRSGRSGKSGSSGKSMTSGAPGGPRKRKAALLDWCIASLTTTVEKFQPDMRLGGVRVAFY